MCFIEQLDIDLRTNSIRKQSTLRAKDVFAKVPEKASNLNYPNTKEGKQNHFDESAGESSKVTIPNAPAPQNHISLHLNRNSLKVDKVVDYRGHPHTKRVL